MKERTRNEIVPYGLTPEQQDAEEDRVLKDYLMALHTEEKSEWPALARSSTHELLANLFSTHCGMPKEEALQVPKGALVKLFNKTKDPQWELAGALSFVISSLSMGLGGLFAGTYDHPFSVKGMAVGMGIGVSLTSLLLGSSYFCAKRNKRVGDEARQLLTDQRTKNEKLISQMF